MVYLEAKEDGIKSIGSDYVDRRYIIPFGRLFWFAGPAADRRRPAGE